MPTNRERIGKALDDLVGKEYRRKEISQRTGIHPKQVTNIVFVYYSHRLEQSVDEEGNIKVMILPSDGLPDPVSLAKVTDHDPELKQKKLEQLRKKLTKFKKR